MLNFILCFRDKHGMIIYSITYKAENLEDCLDTVEQLIERFVEYNNSLLKLKPLGIKISRMSLEITKSQI